MFEAVLFLGIPVDEKLQSHIDKANPNAVKLFVNNESDYLHEVDNGSTRYVGKVLETVTNVSSLELVEANVLSLLRRLLGETWSSSEPMVLFATQRPRQHG